MINVDIQTYIHVFAITRPTSTLRWQLTADSDCQRSVDVGLAMAKTWIYGLDVNIDRQGSTNERLLTSGNSHQSEWAGWAVCVRGVHVTSTRMQDAAADRYTTSTACWPAHRAEQWYSRSLPINRRNDGTAAVSALQYITSVCRCDRDLTE